MKNILKKTSIPFSLNFKKIKKLILFIELKIGDLQHKLGLTEEIHNIEDLK